MLFAILLVGIVRDAQLEIRRRHVGLGSGPQTQSNAPLVPCPGVVAEGDVQLLLQFRVLGPVPLEETKERAIASSVTENGTHLVAFRQAVARCPETFIELDVVRFEHRVHIGVLQIGPPLKEEIEEIPAPGPKGHVERRVPLELQPVATLQ